MLSGYSSLVFTNYKPQKDRLRNVIIPITANLSFLRLHIISSVG